MTHTWIIHDTHLTAALYGPVICVCVCVCAGVCVHACVRVCVCVCMCDYACVCVCVCACVYVLLCVFTCSKEVYLCVWGGGGLYAWCTLEGVEERGCHV